MPFFRQYIAPFLIFLVFGISLLAVSIRSFLPGDMAAPAPIEPVTEQVVPLDKNAQAPTAETVAGLPPALSALIKGSPEDLGFPEQL